MRVGVLGAGSWGTALARMLANKGIKTSLYMRDRIQCQAMVKTRVNEKYLPGINLPKSLILTTDIIELTKNSEVLLFSVPTSSFRETLEKTLPYMRKDQIIVNAAKGIENHTLLRISEIVASLSPENAFVTLSGPSHAEEVALDYPTTVTVASNKFIAAKTVQQLFSTDNFRVYTNSDIIGVELGGALKNVIALAAGVSDGLGYGDNTKAAIMTRGITEMARFGKALGAKTETFFGLSGIGDLIVTCTSMHSRNRRAGILIGQGKTSAEAIAEVGMVVEGIRTTESVHDMLKSIPVEMPITETMYRVLFKNYGMDAVVENLMTRESKDETEGLMF